MKVRTMITLLPSKSEKPCTDTKMSLAVRRRLDECGAAVSIPSTRTGIAKRIAEVEEQLRAHAGWGQCPMDGTNDCCDALVVELKLLNSYLGVVELYGEMCDRLHETTERHKIGLGGEQVDELVIGALESALAPITERETARAEATYLHSNIYRETRAEALRAVLEEFIELRSQMSDHGAPNGGNGG